MMSEIEKNKMKEIARAFNDEDQRLILSQFKTVIIQEELERRTDVTNQILAAVYDIVYSTKVNSINDAEDTIRMLRKILAGREHEVNSIHIQ